MMEHPRHEIASRTRHLIHDHHLRSPGTGRWTREGIAVAGHVVEVAVEIALQHVDNVVGRRTAAVVALIDNRALFILLREVIAVEAGVAGLPGARYINVSELTVGKL